MRRVKDVIRQENDGEILHEIWTRFSHVPPHRHPVLRASFVLCSFPTTSTTDPLPFSLTASLLLYECLPKPLSKLSIPDQRDQNQKLPPTWRPYTPPVWASSHKNWLLLVHPVRPRLLLARRIDFREMKLAETETEVRIGKGKESTVDGIGMTEGTEGVTVTRRGAGVGIVSESGIGTEKTAETEIEMPTGREREIRTRRNTYASDVRVLNMKSIAGRRGLPLLPLIMEMAIEVEKTGRMEMEEHRGGSRRICIRQEGVVEVEEKVDMGMAEVVEVDMEVVGILEEEVITSRGMWLIFILASCSSISFRQALTK